MTGSPISVGKNTIIGDDVTIGQDVVIGHNCIIEEHVCLGDRVHIDHNTIVRSDVSLGNDTMIGAGCIIGERQMDFYQDRQYHRHELKIGQKSLIRSGSIIYSGSVIGDGFQTGHQTTIREETEIGDYVSVGTFSDIQGYCKLGNYVRLHSNVHIGQYSRIDDCVWIFPYVVLTNDPTPPSENLIGVHVHSFAIICTNVTVLPNLEIMGDALIGAGSLVAKDVPQYSVVVGNPAKQVGDVREIRNKVTGEEVYPWRYHFDRHMPWEHCGFDQWYESLDEDTKKLLFS